MTRAGAAYLLCCVVGLAALAACAPPRMAPSLEPAANARIWPPPPEVPRYAYVRTLTGEQDFADPAPARETGKQILEWIVGIVLGAQTPLELQRPVDGVVDDRGRILVTDMSHGAVIVFDMQELRVEKWDEAYPGTGFVAPVAIAPDGAGGVWVTDTELKQVIRLGPGGEPLGTLGDGLFQRPTGIARDPVTGRIFVTDTSRHRVVVFNADLDVVDVIGGRGAGPGEFNFPTHITVAERRLYVADTLNFRIQVFDLDGEGRLTIGRLGLNVGDMTRPKGVAVGGDGRVYVVESYYDHLLVFDEAGRLLMPIGGTGNEVGHFYLPSGVWTDDRNNVYVADMFNGRISIFRELTPGVLQ